MTKKTKRYNIKVFSKKHDPFSLMYSAGEKSFTVNGRMTFKQAKKTVKSMQFVYPSHFKYRIKRIRTSKKKKPLIWGVI